MQWYIVMKDFRVFLRFMVRGGASKYYLSWNVGNNFGYKMLMFDLIYFHNYCDIVKI